MNGYIFVDDGYPEADEYDSNYLAYDPADSESVRSALRKAQASSEASRLDAGRSGWFPWMRRA